MKKISVVIKEAVENAFVSLGYDKKYGMVSISNRPDLCQYQCNGAMAAVKEYKKAPLVIAEEVADKLKLSEEGKIFEKIEAVKPGFINLTLKDEFLADYVNEMGGNDNFGYETEGKPKKIVIDYGGPNVAKPLHIGHLRSAIIGESIKRTERFVGNEVIGDVHLGDWGLQMGLIITELKHRKPELVYFDESFTGEYPSEAPFTIGELEEIYPAASARSKEDEEYKNEALQATALLQSGNRGYLALWNHILSVSVADLKKNYENLNVSFDLWKKESDAQPYIPDMVEKMKADGFAYTSEGALVVDVAREDDKKEVPPCIILKSDGASLYSTTDLATIVERVKLFNPTDILYVVDKRQEMHFEQVFRTAKKTGIAPPELNLTFLGFGTMNGKDGKPFKTREGGVLRLERLISETRDSVLKRMEESKDNGLSQEEKEETAGIVALAALKYGDLSNQATKDYIFDLEKFTAFEGNTGPYILYTIVRISSILRKYAESKGEAWKDSLSWISENAKNYPIGSSGDENVMALAKILAAFQDEMRDAWRECAPHKICTYIYSLSNQFNSFYHNVKILTEEDEQKKKEYIGLLCLSWKVLMDCIQVLGFSAPERM